MGLDNNYYPTVNIPYTQIGRDKGGGATRLLPTGPACLAWGGGRPGDGLQYYLVGVKHTDLIHATITL
jgi:hypothetical protein